MNKLNSKSWSMLKQKIKKNNKKYVNEIKEFMKNPVWDTESEEEESESYESDDEVKKEEKPESESEESDSYESSESSDELVHEERLLRENMTPL